MSMKARFGLAVVATFAPVLAQAAALPSGLIGYWPGDGNPIDFSITDNSGRFSGAYAPGLGGRQAFDLSTGVVRIADNPAYTLQNYSGWTVNFWVNGPGVYLGQDQGPGQQPKWFVDYGYIYGGTTNTYGLHINTSTGSPRAFLQSNSEPTPSGWNQVTVVKQAASVSFYLNGAAIGSAPYADITPDVNAPLTFGDLEGCCNYHGLMQGVMMFNRPLSAAEVAALPAPNVAPVPDPITAKIPDHCTSLADMSGCVVYNVSALNSEGLKIVLGAGAHDILFVGKAGGGLYDAWNPWGGGASGCNLQGANCAMGWFDSVVIQPEDGSTDPLRLALLNSDTGENNLFETPEAALAAYQSQTLMTTTDLRLAGWPPNAGFTPLSPSSFTTALKASGRLFVADTPYSDNAGGVSFIITNSGPIPEPGAWLSMTMGLGLLGTAMRARRGRGLFKGRQSASS